MTEDNKGKTYSRKDSVLMYGDYGDYIDKLPMAERGRLFTAILAFARGEELPADLLHSRLTALVYRVIIGQAGRDREKYIERCERNRELANRRWSRQGDAGTGTAGDNAGNAKSSAGNANAYQNEYDPDHGHGYGHGHGNENENDRERGSADAAEGGKIPPAPPATERTGRETRRRERKPAEKPTARTFDVDEFFRRALISTYGEDVRNAPDFPPYENGECPSARCNAAPAASPGNMPGGIDSAHGTNGTRPTEETAGR